MSSSHRRAQCIERVPAGFGGRLRGKGPRPITWERDLAAQPILLRGVLGQHPAQVSLAEDQHPIGDFGADGQHEAFGEAVRPRTARRDLDHLDPRIGQHRVERGRELSRAIADQESEPRNVFVEVNDEVAGLLGGPGPNGLAFSLMVGVGGSGSGGVG